jgi:hypothetical protein
MSGSSALGGASWYHPSNDSGEVHRTCHDREFRDMRESMVCVMKAVTNCARSKKSRRFVPRFRIPAEHQFIP